MVGMVVGDEDVADVLQPETAAHELLARPVTAIDHVNPVADYDSVAGHVLRAAHARAGARAEDVELGVALRRGASDAGDAQRGGSGNRSRRPQEAAAVDSPVVTHFDYPSDAPPPGGGMVNPCSLGHRLIGGSAVVNQHGDCSPASTPLRGRACAALAQLVEHLIRNEGVTGSSPVSGTSPILGLADVSVRRTGWVAYAALAPDALCRRFCSSWAISRASIGLPNK